MRDKVIICFFGVVSRSIKFTNKILQERLINIVKQEYDVDIYVFNNNVENDFIDEIQQNNTDVNLLQCDFFEEKTQTTIDTELYNYITFKNIVWNMTYYDDPCFNKLTKINVFRQLYSEYQVGLFLEKRMNDYKSAIICGPDFYLLNNISLDDIKKTIDNDSDIYTTMVNDGYGYTNGFYIGSLKPMIQILQRYSILEQLLPTHLDYEYLLKKTFEIYKINRKITNMLFEKIRSNYRHTLLCQRTFPDVIFPQIIV